MYLPEVWNWVWNLLKFDKLKKYLDLGAVQEAEEPGKNSCRSKDIKKYFRTEKKNVLLLSSNLTEKNREEKSKGEE